MKLTVDALRISIRCALLGAAVRGTTTSYDAVLFESCNNGAKPILVLVYDVIPALILPKQDQVEVIVMTGRDFSRQIQRMNAVWKGQFQGYPVNCQGKVVGYFDVENGSHFTYISLNDLKKYFTEKKAIIPSSVIFA